MEMDEFIILPLGMMMFFEIILHPFVVRSGGNEYIFGILAMYISWLIIYLTFIKPKMKKKK